jgi:nitrate reductase NapE component
VGSQSRINELRAQQKSLGGDVSGRHVRAAWSLPVFATFVIFGFLAVSVVPPYGSAFSSAFGAPIADRRDLQSLDVSGEYSNSAVRDEFTTSEVYVGPVAPAAGIPDPDTAQGIALAMVTARGWGLEEFDCLVALWNRESHWNVYAHNASSGAYGIPQALPGNKMATAGADWATNPTTQIKWGLGYIAARYDTPCGAWAHSEEHNWY